jgi:hypothetical protein
MERYKMIHEAIYGYLENMLMNEGANTWDEYKAIVGPSVGPYDKELWDLFIVLSRSN